LQTTQEDPLPVILYFLPAFHFSTTKTGIGVQQGVIISNGAFVVSNNTGVNNAGVLMISSGWESRGPLTISGNSLAGVSFSSPAFGGNHLTFVGYRSGN